MKVRNTRLRGGHAPGLVRDAFCAALDKFTEWNDGEPEPVVEFEVNYESVEIPISRACTLVWNCTDILPGSLVQWAERSALEFERVTYASVARAMRQAIRERTAALEVQSDGR
jgi:hypothetical protein